MMNGLTRFQKHGKCIRRGCALLTALLVAFALLPSAALAEEGGSGCLCGHVHDAACGYSADTPCTHVCVVSRFYQADGSDWTEGPLDTLTAGENATAAQIAGALPSSLPASLLCTEERVQVPVRWSSGDYDPTLPGTYTFTASIAAAACSYSGTMPTYSLVVPETSSSPDTPAQTAAPVPAETPADAPAATETSACAVGYIGEDDTAVYALADTGSEELAKLSRNTQVSLLEEAEGWAHIACTVEGVSLTGYVPADVVRDDQIDEIRELLENRSVTGTVTEAGGDTVITVSGLLPEDVTLSARGVSAEEAASYVGEGEEILFAYDIKLLRPAAGEGGQPTEYQPASTVTVTVTPSTPIASPVTVTHVSRDEEGTVTTQQISASAATEEGGVAFPADGFSTYVITLNNAYTVTFDVDTGFTVEYSTDNTTFVTLDTATVATTGPLYFRVAEDNPGVYRSGTIGTLTYADGVYTLDSITGNATVCIKEYITFYLDQQSVSIGSSTFAGKDSDGVVMTGPIRDTNRYKVTQTRSATATENAILLKGSSDVPTFDLTLLDVNNATAGNKSQSSSGATGGIVIASNTHCKVILRLSGTNAIGRLHYCNSAADTSLTITSAAGDGSTSGTLTAETLMAWSAAIGGIDSSYENSENIIINGGTIYATGISTSAIGGGGNGQASVTINGGSVTAINNGTGATIGGGGGQSSYGGAGTVTINGGTVNATNNGNMYPLVLGGGASPNSFGGMGTVTITGGTVNAGNNGDCTAVGGGNSGNNNAGAGNVSITGGAVTVTGTMGGGGTATGTAGAGTVAISGGIVSVTRYGDTWTTMGGGNANSGTAGAGTVTISGGTVVAQRIGGGYKVGSGAYRTTGNTVTITGGSVNGTCVGITPTNGTDNGSETVYINTITLSGVAEAKSVTGITCSESYYGTNDLRTDADGKLYFWLPEGETTTSATTAATTYYVGLCSSASGGAAATFYLVTVSGTSIYGAGCALLVQADGTGTTVYLDLDRDGVLDTGEPSLTGANVADAPADGADLSGWTVYGGGATALSGSTLITQLSGRVSALYGGGTEAVTGSSAIALKGGTVTTVSGAGTGDNGTVSGTKTVSVTGSPVVGSSTAGIDLASLTGSTVTISGRLTGSAGAIHLVAGSTASGTKVATGAASGDTAGLTVNGLSSSLQLARGGTDVLIVPVSISATVPLNMMVVVGADGTITAPASSDYCIRSTSLAAIQVVSVAWAMESDANTIFHDSTALTLTLNGTSLTQGSTTNVSGTDWQAAASNGTNAATLPLTAVFTLGSGNYLLVGLATARQFCTLTYTIGYQP